MHITASSTITVLLGFSTILDREIQLSTISRSSISRPRFAIPNRYSWSNPGILIPRLDLGRHLKMLSLLVYRVYQWNLNTYKSLFKREICEEQFLLEEKLNDNYAPISPLLIFSPHFFWPQVLFVLLRKFCA